MINEKKIEHSKTYSYVGFLNGKLSLNSGPTKMHSYVGFLNGKLSLDSETSEIIESKENIKPFLDDFS